MYRLITFGGLALESDGRPVPSPALQPRRLALLVLLASARDRGVSRDKLLGLLWAERPQDRARHALDQLLYATRRDLGRDVVRSGSGIIRLDGRLVRADVAELEAALADGNAAAALRLYTGPFLDGVYIEGAPAFERWAETERFRLQERLAAALQRHAEAAAARGDAAGALDAWRRLAAIDPFSSRYAAGLIRALIAAGDAAGALRHARAHEELVRRELDVAPDPSIAALVAELGRAPAVALPPMRTVADASAATPGAEPPALPPAAAASTGSGRPAVGRRLATPGRLVRLGVFGRRGRLGVIGAACVAGALIAFGTAPTAVPAAEQDTAVRAAAGELYLHGRLAWNRRSREGLEQAVVYFRRATEQDPTYAAAFAGLADAYVMLGYHGFADGATTFAKGRAAAERALELEPANAHAHAALGVALQWEKRWAEAEQSLLRSLEHAPDYATAHQWYALLLTILGRREEAVRHATEAARLDPLSVQIQNTWAITYYHARMPDSALHVYDRMFASEPDTAWLRQNPWVLANFGKVAAAAGRHEQAVALIQRAAQTLPGHPRPLYELAVAHYRAGNAALAERIFADAEPRHPHHALYRALLHAWRGDLDAAFEGLDRIEDWGPVNVLTISSNPSPPALRTDPRYAALHRRLLLPLEP